MPFSRSTGRILQFCWSPPACITLLHLLSLQAVLPLVQKVADDIIVLVSFIPRSWLTFFLHIQFNFMLLWAGLCCPALAPGKSLAAGLVPTSTSTPIPDPHTCAFSFLAFLPCMCGYFPLASFLASGAITQKDSVAQKLGSFSQICISCEALLQQAPFIYAEEGCCCS